jgi:Dyp-type peroxidase family
MSPMSDPAVPPVATPSLPPTIPLDNIQAGIFDPTALAVETHVFLAMTSGASGRAFLRSIISHITTEAQVAPGDGALGQVRVNLGITSPGLIMLGVDPSVVSSFPEEFRDGMAARAAILGDNGASAPSEWDPTFRPAADGGPTFHLWLMVQGPDAASRDAELAALAALAASHAVVQIGLEEGAQLGPELAPAKEHFGFNDNLSQPGIEGVGQPVHPGQGTLQPDGTWTPIPVGCFLLGYPNGYGDPPSHPTDEALRQDSTFMVFRKLSQDVASFRGAVKETAGLLGLDEERCAAKFVGRWRSGAPLEITPDHDDPSIVDAPETANAFSYDAAPFSDCDGVRVPRLAHIRRVNPRDSLGSRSIIDPTNHRIIRRSAPYGPYLPESADGDDGQPRGLLFRAFNASILDQFEMIQSEWVNNANETNGLSTDRDPFVGSVEPMGPPARQLTASFTIPIPSADGSSFSCPTRHGLPQFVTVKGGAYFFVPSLSALAHLATDPAHAAVPSGGVPLDKSFVDVYRSIVAAPGNPPEAVLREQIGLVVGYQGHLVKLGNDLRASDSTKIFPTSIGVLLGTSADVREVFTRDDVFSVAGYGARLTDLTGPFLLGMDAGAQYDRESAIMRFVAPSSDLPALDQWLARFAASVVKDAAGAPGTTFDLVPLVADRVPVGFVGHYFGVPGPDDETLMTWLRAIGIYVFEWWSTLFPLPIKTFTTSITPTFEQYLDGLIDERSEAIAAGDPNVPDDVLTRLLDLPGVDSASHPRSLDRLGIRRNLAGFALGSSVALSTAIVSAVEYLLAPENLSALRTTRAAAKAGDRDLVGQCMLEAARLGQPSPPSVFRTALADHVLAAGTAREKLIPKGSIVVLNPAIAMTDPEAVADPMTFRPGRPLDTYMMFGEGKHTCFGTAIGMMILTSVGSALFSLDGLHQVSPVANGTAFPSSGYPATYLLSTAAAAP